MQLDLFDHLQIAIQDNRCGQPITILFADAAYAEILDNWLRHALPYVADALIVFSLDAATDAKMSEQGIKSVLLPFSGVLDELWVLRLCLFEALIRMDVSFIHSDVDAVWQADPRQFCYNLNVDLAISSGTVWPAEAVDLWGFVLCCGFFYVRAKPEIARFFAEVKQAAIIDRDDQAALNRILLNAGVEWSFDAVAYDVQEVMGRKFRNFEKVIFGRTATCFNLSLALLPQDLFQRIPRVCDRPFVKHPLTPKEPTAKRDMLRELGCWLDS